MNHDEIDRTIPDGTIMIDAKGNRYEFKNDQLISGVVDMDPDILEEESKAMNVSENE